jgi:uncharacterized repeat protein (TIGR02543 family)
MNKGIIAKSTKFAVCFGMMFGMVSAASVKVKAIAAQKIDPMDCTLTRGTDGKFTVSTSYTLSDDEDLIVVIADDSWIADENGNHNAVYAGLEEETQNYGKTPGWTMSFSSYSYKVENGVPFSVTDAELKKMDAGVQIFVADEEGSSYYPSKWALKRFCSHTVSVTGGTASVSTAYESDTVAVSASVPEGKEFAGWTASSADVKFADASSAETSFTMLDADVTVTASFKDKTASGKTVSSSKKSGYSVPDTAVKERN